MGCTPSTQSSDTGVTLNCDNLPTGNHSGIQGQFRATGSEERDSTPHKNVPVITDTQQIQGDGSVFANLTEKRENQTIKFGPMCLKLPSIKVLFVFAKEDAQSRALRWAAEKLGYDCTIVNNFQEANAAYTKRQHHLVVIDTRQQSDGLDSMALCRSLRSTSGSQFTCIVAIVKKSLGEREEASVIPLLKAGFNRWLLETCSLGVCLNELIQLEHNEIITQLKLQSAQALFAALDCCRDSIMVTGPTHDIQFVNRPTEKIFGTPVTDIIGKNAQDLHKSDTLKSDISEMINKHVNMGKEWEGTLFHKKKTGESVPLWSRIIPIEFHHGIVDYLVYVKDIPHYADKNESDITTYTNMKTARKPSYDVRYPCSDAGINRRQSFAKFHAMTIEAPITKVINMLMATQETSPLPTVQAIDKVLDILRSTELYSPQFNALNQNHLDDQVTSDLVSGLIAGNKSALRKMSHELLLRGNVPQTPTSSALSLSTAPFEIKILLEKETDWEFDIIELEKISNKRPLIWLGMAVFARFNVCNTLSCDEATLHNWLSLIEANYHNNPYHNSTHAADVMQATAYFLQNQKIKTILNPLDEAICLIAAVVHDVDHPGKTSAFLCNSGSQLAILYNDLCVLESHHTASAFKLTTSSDKVNILKNLNEDSFRAVRQSIIDMVLATEMTKHFEHVSKFVNIFNKNIPPEDEILEEEECTSETAEMVDSEIVVPVKRMLIKCADISNPARPWKLCVDWANRIANEYCNQTDEEKRLGLPVVMPAFDRATCSIPKSQMSFMDFFVNDMFDVWDVFGNFPELMEHVKVNYQNWKEQEGLRDKQKQAQEQQQTS